ncbi:hypothetical protein [Brevibacillus borstelensis]|nr:hypothetical protein [Brevibacillus borstelensis]MCM3468771.1 hypothetical protein [Brevibacillus borstelensis]MCM3590022.1 hypothetical protein [Brevibacillus borstelensis]MED1853104.1 hypothetical protein [Brevibacillus borstelensis]WNF06945.1 hypothetical protein RFB14_05795 [Brevibacillus borstelensis]
MKASLARLEMPVDRAVGEEMKKGENAQGTVGHCGKPLLSGSIPKA